MRGITSLLAFALPILAASMTVNTYGVSRVNGKIVKTQVFHSSPIYLSPGLVSNKYYYDIDFPRGHIAIKSLDAEVVHEDGIPVPLHETYLHHWVIVRYFSLVGSNPNLPQGILAGNSGVCKGLSQYFGLGSETRKTSTWVPDPYGIEVGNSKEIPEGYEEKWMLNVHAIDTRGVVDRLGCTECRCNLYNVTTTRSGQPLRKGYLGGLFCCEDQAQCQLKEGFIGVTRKLYLKYTVKWVDWDENIMPVKIYIFDVTSTWKNSNNLDNNPRPKCKIEYDVKPCSSDELLNSKCLHSKKTDVFMPHGGEIVYAAAHQHSGGVGSALYGQNGRVLCSSMPHYGSGKEAGNEAGYIVGMSTCYPRDGSARIGDGEILTLESNYSSSQMHTGVMGLFYILLLEAKQSPNSTLSSSSNFMES